MAVGAISPRYKNWGAITSVGLGVLPADIPPALGLTRRPAGIDGLAQTLGGHGLSLLEDPTEIGLRPGHHRQR